MTLPLEIDEADRVFALRESRSFFDGFLKQLGADSFWVNPPESWGLARLKVVQLQAAAGSGFQIPPTLCSNDPGEIRKFLRQHGGRGIYKSFSPACWSLQEGVAILFSTVIDEEELPSDALLRAAPGIFQPVVEKLHELRVTFMGARCFAVKIQSQEIATAKIDWRAADEPIPMEATLLPEGVLTACRKVMKRLKIVFGCFDLIVTPEGDYVFLEVNEAGAFLWLEENLPTLPLLDAFCEFLIQGTADFSWEENAQSLHLADSSGEPAALPNARIPRCSQIPWTLGC